MKTKLFSVILCIAMLVSCLATSSYADGDDIELDLGELFPGTGFSVSFDTISCTLTVSGVGNMPDNGMVIPESYAPFIKHIIIEYGVTSIRDLAFANLTSLETVTISDTVTNIGSLAFANSSDFTIKGYAGTYAEEYANANGIPFEEITSTTVPEEDSYSVSFEQATGTLTVSGRCDIHNNAFDAFGAEVKAYVQSVVINSGITGIGDGVFADFSSLTSIRIPESVVSIADDAFDGSDNVIIYGYSNSYAEEYADQNNIPFVCLNPELVNDSSYEACFFTDASADIVLPGESFTFDIFLSGTYDGYSFEIPKNYDGITITNVEGKDSCLADNAGNFYRVSVLGGKVRNNSDLKLIATVTAIVNDGAKSGIKILNAENIMISTEMGEPVSTCKYSFTYVTVDDMVREFEITEVHEPATNEVRVFNAESSDTSRYLVTDVDWIGDFDGNSFKPCSVYTVKVTLESASSLFSLSPYPAVATINGEDANVSYDEASGNLILSYTFPETEPIHVTDVELNETSVELDIGDTFTLEATVYPEDATYKNVVWTSSNEAVATVENGVVTAVSSGNATITVTTVDGRKTASCEVAVVTHVTSVEITTVPTLMKPGLDTLTLDAKVYPDNATDKSLTWFSSNPEVASVENGVVTALTPGTATITVTTVDGGFTDTVDVTVDEYDSFVYTEAKKVTLRNRAFKYTVKFAGTYDGYSFEVAKDLDGMKVTEVIGIDSGCMIDDHGDYYLVSVIGGKNRVDSDKTDIVSVTVEVDFNAEAGSRTLPITNLMLSTSTGDNASFCYNFSDIYVSDRLEGDINGDGVFDYFDVSKLFAFYRTKATIANDVDPDINCDGTFDYYDVSKLFAVYRRKATFEDVRINNSVIYVDKNIIA